MRWYREFQPGAPYDSTPFSAFRPCPRVILSREHWSKKMCRPPRRGNNGHAEAARQRSARRLPKPLIDWAGPNLLSGVAGACSRAQSAGNAWYWKGDFVKTLPDGYIDPP